MSTTCTVSKVVNLPNSLSQQILDENGEIVEQDSKQFGGVLSGSQYAWLVHGPHIEVYNSKNGVKIGAWTFGGVTKDTSTQIVCCEELKVKNGFVPLLLLGIENQLGGMICVFHFSSSSVLRAIQLPDRISSLHIVDNFDRSNEIAGPLKCFEGILAVGLQGGDVYLLDMCVPLLESCLRVSVNCLRDESNPSSVIVITKKSIRDIYNIKERNFQSNTHVALHLNAIFDIDVPHFVLKSPKGGNLLFVNKMEATASALLFSRNLMSLLVGYNFGAFQLWDLNEISLVHTSSVNEEYGTVSVTHFAVQEPSDDPRAYCYFWTIYSNQDPLQKGFPLACLHAIVYEEKKNQDFYGNVYRGFRSCSLAFKMQLDGFDPRKTNLQGAYCLSTQVLNKKTTNSNGYDESLSLAAIFWNAWDKNSTHTYLALFDLNQWYKEQLPNQPQLGYFKRYMTVTCLSDYYNADKEERALILNGRIADKSLIQFLGTQKLEEHYYPTALGYDCYVLTEKDVGVLQIKGEQMAFLHDLQESGPLTLIKPAEAYRKALAYGLVPVFVDSLPLDSTNSDMQRDFILSIALEQRLLGFLTKCASTWANGSFTSAGCSFDFLLRWAWNRTTVLKSNADKLCIPLFDYSEIQLDTNSHNLLINCKRQLMTMAKFYEHVLNNFKEYLPSIAVIEKQLELLRIATIYLEVILWLLYVGILPEYPLSNFANVEDGKRLVVPYPVERLTEYYNERRTNLSKLNERNFGTRLSLLYIDNLLDNECGGPTLNKQWQVDSGNGLYPPVSIQALLRTYLVSDAEITSKHGAVMYAFLDMASTLDENVYKEIITHLLKFPTVFKMTRSLIKITQAFWQLDHEDFETAVHQLLDPTILPGDLKKWHHNIILRALQVQEQYKQALFYLQVRKPPIKDIEDIHLGISLYVSNKMLDEALYFLRQNRKISNEDALITYFYKECNRVHQIFDVLCRKLEPKEESLLIKYIEDIKHPMKEEFLVTYYIQHSRYLEIYDIQKKSKKRIYEQGLLGQSNMSIGENTVKLMNSLMPSIMLDLMESAHKEKTVKNVDKPKPLSVFMYDGNEKNKYRSTILKASLTKAQETWSMPVPNKISTETTPFLKTPQAFPEKTRFYKSILYPRIMEKVVQEEIELEPTPAKRQRIGEDSSYKANPSHPGVKLDTPVVKRKVPQRSNVTLNDTVNTPQSILKVRKGSDSPILSRGYSTTPEFLEDSVIMPFSSNDGIANSTCFPMERKASSLGISPRKSLPRTPIVRFANRQSSSFSGTDDSVNTSSVTSKTSPPTTGVIREKEQIISRDLRQVATVPIRPGKESLCSDYKQSNKPESSQMLDTKHGQKSESFLVTADVHSSGESNYFSPTTSMNSDKSTIEEDTNKVESEKQDNVVVEDETVNKRFSSRLITSKPQSLDAQKDNSASNSSSTGELTLPKLTGRRSLSRKVMESNALKVFSPRRSARTKTAEEPKPDFTIDESSATTMTVDLPKTKPEASKEVYSRTKTDRIVVSEEKSGVRSEDHIMVVEESYSSSTNKLEFIKSSPIKSQRKSVTVEESHLKIHPEQHTLVTEESYSKTKTVEITEIDEGETTTRKVSEKNVTSSKCVEEEDPSTSSGDVEMQMEKSKTPISKNVYDPSFWSAFQIKPLNIEPASPFPPTPALDKIKGRKSVGTVDKKSAQSKGFSVDWSLFDLKPVVLEPASPFPETPAPPRKPDETTRIKTAKCIFDESQEENKNKSQEEATDKIEIHSSDEEDIRLELSDSESVHQSKKAPQDIEKDVIQIDSSNDESSNANNENSSTSSKSLGQLEVNISNVPKSSQDSSENDQQSTKKEDLKSDQDEGVSSSQKTADQAIASIEIDEDSPVQKKDTQKDMGNTVATVHADAGTSVEQLQPPPISEDKAVQEFVENKEAGVGNEAPARRLRSSSVQSDVPPAQPRTLRTRSASLDQSIQAGSLLTRGGRKRRLQSVEEISAPEKELPTTPTRRSTRKNSKTEIESEEVFTPTRRSTRLRSQSEEQEGVLTPTRRSTRLRSQSEEPEEVLTPSRRKTRSSVTKATQSEAKPRTLRTRSISTEKIDEEEEETPMPVKKTMSIHNLPTIDEDCVPSPPKQLRRSSRTNSCDESVRSTRSASEIKSTSVNSKRITRKQKAILQQIVDIPVDGSDNESPRINMPNLPEIDPINLLGRTGFEGKADPDEEAMRQSRASSVTSRSEASRQRSLSVSSTESDIQRKGSPGSEQEKTSTRSRRSKKEEQDTSKVATPSTIKTRRQSSSSNKSVTSKPNVNESQEAPAPRRRGRPRNSEKS